MASIFTSNTIKFVLMTSNFCFHMKSINTIRHTHRWSANVLHSNFGWFSMNSPSLALITYLVSSRSTFDFVHRSISCHQSNYTNDISFYRQFDASMRGVVEMSFRFIYVIFLLTMSFASLFCGQCQRYEIEALRWNPVKSSRWVCSGS